MKQILTLFPMFGLVLTASAEPQIGQPAPDFTATDISGKTVKLSDYKGKIVVLESFGWQSPRTRQEYTSAVAQWVQHRLATNHVVYIIIDTGLDQLTPAAAKTAWVNRKMEITDWIMDGPDAALTQLYGLKESGQMMVIDRQGVLVYSGDRDDTPNLTTSPLHSKNYVLQAVLELLAGKKVSTPQVPVRPLAPDDSPALQIGKPAPDFIATDINGHTFRLSGYKGKIVVMEAYEMGCVFVDREYESGAMPQLQAELAAKDVVWLVINPGVAPKLQGPNAPAEAKKEPAYAKMVFSRYIIDDAHHSLVNRYRIWVTPQMFVIDKEGRLAYMGAIDDVQNIVGDRLAARNYVRQAVNELLGGRRVSTTETKPFGCALMYPGMWNAEMFAPPPFLRNQ